MEEAVVLVEYPKSQLSRDSTQYILQRADVWEIVDRLLPVLEAIEINMADTKVGAMAFELRLLARVVQCALFDDHC